MIYLLPSGGGGGGGIIKPSDVLYAIILVINSTPQKTYRVAQCTDSWNRLHSLPATLRRTPLCSAHHLMGDHGLRRTPLCSAHHLMGDHGLVPRGPNSPGFVCGRRPPGAYKAPSTDPPSQRRPFLSVVGSLVFCRDTSKGVLGWLLRGVWGKKCF
jgi:hypothetical protein